MSKADLRSNATLAHVAPLLAFMVLQSLVGIVEVDNPDLPWYVSSPEHWVYPLQTVVCFGLLVFFWRHYSFAPVRGSRLAVLLGIVGILIWFLPSWLYGPLGVAQWPEVTFGIPMLVEEGTPIWNLFGLAVREEGFDPSIWEGQPVVFTAVVLMRFLRMVLVVALIEEIFWRGFLMRYLVNLDRPFSETPFGAHAWRAYWITTIAFTLIHAPEDWLGAFVYGSLTYWVAIRTKSLFACVLMHGVANLALGIYVMVTKQWGFW